MLQIQTKISFWVLNKPRVIIWTQMKDFEIKTCEEKFWVKSKVMVETKSRETFRTVIQYFCVKTFKHCVWVQQTSFLCPYGPFGAKMRAVYYFGTKIGTFGFPKCKEIVKVQIQTKISFWFQNKPRVIIWSKWEILKLKHLRKKYWVKSKAIV